MTKLKKKALIVGIGGHAHVWKKALSLHDDWELSAIIDTNTEKLDHSPSTWEVDESETYTTMEEATQFGKNSYDLAIIETPTFSHHVLAMEAMELGLNVICEKNMACTIDQGRQMVKTALKYPTLCSALGTQTRYFPQNWTIKKYLLENKEQLGDITSLNLTFLYNWGKTRQGWRRWLRDLFLEDMAPHHLDLIRYLTDMDVVQVSGVNFTPSFSYFKGSSTTFAILALSKPENYNNPDNWIYATYRGDWQKKGALFHQVDVNCIGGDINLLEKGKEKNIVANIYEDQEGFKYSSKNVPISNDIEYNSENYDAELYLLDEMSKGIDSKGKNQPSTNFCDAFKSFAKTRGIVESFETKKAVFIPKYWKNLLN